MRARVQVRLFYDKQCINIGSIELPANVLKA